MNQKQKNQYLIISVLKPEENFLHGTVEFFYSTSSLKSEFTQFQRTNTLKLRKLQSLRSQFKH